MPPVPVLSFTDVRKRFGSLNAVDGLTLDVQAGECLGLLGPNGAGKTTTLRLALGLSRPDSGQVSLLGLPMPDQGSLARTRVGVVPQSDALDPDFTIRENLTVFARYFALSGAELESRIESLLAFASLERRADEAVTKLSGGQKRRLTLARALINNPDLIFLDEPTTALDPQARHLIWERLQALREQGKTLLLTTHFMDEAQRLCDRIVIIDKGRIITQGGPRELIAKHIASEVIELFGRDAKAWLSTHAPSDPTARIESSGETVFVYTRDSRIWLDRLHDSALAGAGAMTAADPASSPTSSPAASPVAGAPSSPTSSPLSGPSSSAPPASGQFDFDYLCRPANLEDVFLRLTGRDLRDA